jgi:hypothetical protein
MTYTIAECTVNKLLMMGRGTARYIYRFIFKPKLSWEINASVGFIIKKFRLSFVMLNPYVTLLNADTSNVS